MFLVSVARENLIDRLSKHQLAVAEILVKGKRYKDIARELAISPSTVTNHVNQIHARLEIENRGGLMISATASGQIVGYNLVGYLAISATLTAMVFVGRIQMHMGVASDGKS